jgi:hypothetical protein
VPAFVAPNVLKWHWWRFNGYGFLAGMVAGTAAAVIKVYLPIHPVFAFLLILAVSFLASIVVCLLTAAERDDVLMGFYRQVRPWGFWQTSLVTAPICLAIQHWSELTVSLVVCAATSAVLKLTWYDRLGPGEMYLVGPAGKSRAMA